jgi:hypothetical protein
MGADPKLPLSLPRYLELAELNFVRHPTFCLA